MTCIDDIGDLLSRDRSNIMDEEKLFNSEDCIVKVIHQDREAHLRVRNRRIQNGWLPWYIRLFGWINRE